MSAYLTFWLLLAACVAFLQASLMLISALVRLASFFRTLSSHFADRCWRGGFLPLQGGRAAADVLS